MLEAKLKKKDSRARAEEKRIYQAELDAQIAENKKEMQKLQERIDRPNNWENDYQEVLSNIDNRWENQNKLASKSATQPPPDQNENYWRYPNNQGSATNDPVRLKRGQELAYLLDWRRNIDKMPEGPGRQAALRKHGEMLSMVISDGKLNEGTGLRDALRKKLRDDALLRDKSTVSGGPVTCGYVNNKWECYDGFSLPQSRIATDGPPITPGAGVSGSLDRRQITIPESEVKEAAEEMRRELNNK